MRLSTFAGLSFMALGFLLWLDFFTANVPSPTQGDLGFSLIVLGGLLASGGWAWRRNLAKTGTTSLLLVAGLVVLSAGLLVALEGFLLGSQMICGCYIRACNCGATYDAIGGAGLFFAGVGALATASVFTPALGPGPSEPRT